MKKFPIIAALLLFAFAVPKVNADVYTNPDSNTGYYGHYASDGRLVSVDPVKDLLGFREERTGAVITVKADESELRFPDSTPGSVRDLIANMRVHVEGDYLDKSHTSVDATLIVVKPYRPSVKTDRPRDSGQAQESRVYGWSYVLGSGTWTGNPGEKARFDGTITDIGAKRIKMSVHNEARTLNIAGARFYGVNGAPLDYRYIHTGDRVGVIGTFTGNGHVDASEVLEIFPT